MKICETKRRKAKSKKMKEKNMNGLIMIEKKRVLQSDDDTMKGSRRCRRQNKAKQLLDYQTTWKD